VTSSETGSLASLDRPLRESASLHVHWSLEIDSVIQWTSFTFVIKRISFQ